MIVARNVRVGRGEIDLLVRDGGTLVAVEVKTRRRGDPRSRFDDEKESALRAATRRMSPRPSRLDLVTVELGEAVAKVRWVRGVS